MGATTILMRFMFGGVLAGGLALWGGVPSPWGDKFLLGFMSAVRYLR